MEAKRKKEMGSEEQPQETRISPFPDEVLERVMSFVDSHKDRSAVSLVCKDWYTAERWSRTHVFVGNCYSVSPEIAARRFPNVRSFTIKGKPRFSDFNLVPPNWGADIRPWLVVFALAYPFLEELRLKRMAVSDESLDFLVRSFPGFKALPLVSCDGFSTNGLASVASCCRNLTELDIHESVIDDLGGSWLSCFPESFTSLEMLNFSNLNSEVNFDALERLVTRCKSLKVLKVNRNVMLEQLWRLLVRAPQLTELGTGSFSQDHALLADAQLETAFSNCKNLNTLSGLWVISSLYLPALYPACANLSFLNLSYAPLQSTELAKLLPHCPLLHRLWKSVIEACQILFCRQMTNAAVATVVRNCPNFTHFRLCIMNMCEPDYLTNEPIDEAFGTVVKTCAKLQRLAVSGLLTDLAF